MFSIHFLNVGKGNCTLLVSPSGRLTVVDIDNSRIGDESDGLTEPVHYIKNKSKGSIFRFILTHPDMDHMSGLDELARTVSIANFWDTQHSKNIDDNSWDSSMYKKEDWERYLSLRASTQDPLCLRLLRGSTSDCCWVQDELSILSPSPQLVRLAADSLDTDSQKYHHLSYVLMVRHGGTKVLLGGDASPEAWEEILADGVDLKADIFLAPHHGSKNNVQEKVFKKIAPDFVIVSTVEGVEYDYDYYSALAGKRVLSTKHYGTITVNIQDDGKYLPISVERNGD